MYEGEAATGDAATTTTHPAGSDVLGCHCPLHWRRIRDVHAAPTVHQSVGSVTVLHERLVPCLQGETMAGVHAGSFCPRNPEGGAVEELNAFDERTVHAARLAILPCHNIVFVNHLVLPSHHGDAKRVVWTRIHGQGKAKRIFRSRLLRAGCSKSNPLRIYHLSVDFLFPVPGHLHVSLLLHRALLVASHPLFGPLLQCEATRAHRLLLGCDDVVEKTSQAVGTAHRRKAVVKRIGTSNYQATRSHGHLHGLGILVPGLQFERPVLGTQAPNADQPVATHDSQPLAADLLGQCWSFRFRLCSLMKQRAGPGCHWYLRKSQVCKKEVRISRKLVIEVAKGSTIAHKAFSEH
mmetsp:Transcript_59876/g.143029  ORF Transcript_59876/g.143029 Transcript_59876/m.143029 type:complete len:350 (-) Transcript_59876:367-1416(-)